MNTLRIGLAQVRQSDDFDDNATSIFRFLEDAAQQKVQILCFPETQTVGYRAVSYTHLTLPTNREV